MDVAVEFHSLSKTFSMTGWRIGWACGNEEIIKGLSIIKDNIDSGIFGAIQDAGIEGLSNYSALNADFIRIYKERAEVFSKGLNSAGWKFNFPKATFYVWAKPPVKSSSMEIVKRIIKEKAVICTPGSGFGPSGEGYVRFALTRSVERLEEALSRIRELQW
jgi:LL-diaminopimelate aminotransferase